MILQLNTILLFMLASALVLLGLCFLRLHIPDSCSLRNYRMARVIMAVCYFIFAIGDIFEYVFHTDGSDDILLKQMLTLTVAFSQAFLITLACLLLLDTKIIGRKNLVGEILTVSVLIVAIILSYLTLPDVVFEVAFDVFSVAYLLLLAYYSRLFIRCFRHYRRKMDNFFSDSKNDRLDWIKFSFFTSLTVGVMALVSILFMSPVVKLAFEIISIFFYTFFGLRLLNYGYIFADIEKAMEEDKVPEIINISHSNNNILEKKIAQWISNKQFTEKGITIEMLARRFHTNRSYLSAYINSSKGKTFREWINELRIEEAKRLLQETLEMTVQEIAEKSGFSDKSHFSRNFLQYEGITPLAFRKKQN